MKLFHTIILGLACALATVHVSAVKAEKAETKLSDLCIPHLPEQGPWNCDWREIHEKKCATPPAMGLEPVWQTVKSKEDAFGLLKKKYVEFNNAIQFSQWLACQKFRVLVQSRPGPNITELDAWYFRKDIEPYPLGWLNLVRPFGFYYSEGFKLELDQYGQIQNVSVNMIQ
jgi:hypothetical protein